MTTFHHQTFAADLPSIKERVIPELKAQFSAKGMELGQPIFIRIFKETSELELWVKTNDQFELFKNYPICNFSGLLGPKLKEGDHQSPEGFYYVTPKHMNPNSTYHLSFNVGFPNKYDQSHERTGSYLMVHGDCVSIGYYAMSDKNIEEIYLVAKAALNSGQPFFRTHLFPFRMNEENMEKHKDNQWMSFWHNLKQGYDIFENSKVPPNVEVADKQYVFTAQEEILN